RLPGPARVVLGGALLVGGGPGHVGLAGAPVHVNEVGDRIVADADLVVAAPDVVAQGRGPHAMDAQVDGVPVKVLRVRGPEGGRPRRWPACRGRWWACPGCTTGPGPDGAAPRRRGRPAT